MFDVFEPAIQAIIEGLDRVVPADLRAEMVQMLSPEALSSIISGLPTIDVEDWEANTEYTHGLSATSVEVHDICDHPNPSPEVSSISIDLRASSAVVCGGVLASHTEVYQMLILISLYQYP